MEEGEGKKGRDKGGREDQTYLSRFSSNVRYSSLKVKTRRVWSPD